MMSALLVSALVAPVASAATCEPYTHADWRAHMDVADDALSELDRVAASETLDTVRSRMRCLDSVARPDHLARFGRQVALLFYFNQDADQAQRWAALSLTAEPTLPWPDAVQGDHPFRALVDGIELPAPTGPEGRYFVAPKKGGVFHNGTFTATPIAVPETPGFWQMTNKKGALVNAWWQDGTAFPPPVLTTEGGPIAPPKSWTGTPALDPSLVASELTFEIPERAALVLPEPEPEPVPEPVEEPLPEYDDLDFEYIDDEPVDDPAPETGPEEDPR